MFEKENMKFEGGGGKETSPSSKDPGENSEENREEPRWEAGLSRLFERDAKRAGLHSSLVKLEDQVPTFRPG